jgi:hypothetical protein
MFGLWNHKQPDTMSYVMDTAVVLQLTVLTLILSDRLSAYHWPPLPDCRSSLVLFA